MKLYHLPHAPLPLAQIDGDWLLLDTGATHSLAPSNGARFLEAHGPAGGGALAGLLAQAGSGLFPQVQAAVAGLAGVDVQLGGLVGVDTLVSFDLRVDVPGRTIGLRPAGDRAAQGQRVSSEVAHGLPVVHVHVGDQRLRLVLDTGCDTAYLLERPARCQIGPVIEDRHPLVGAFQSQTHVVAAELAMADGSRLQLGEVRFGELPSLLHSSVAMAGMDGVIGADIFRLGVVTFSERMADVRLLEPTGHDALASHYDAMYDDIYGGAYHAATERLVALLRAELSARARVLDIGAGTGRIAVRLAQANHQIVAVEPSGGMLGQALDKAAAAGAEIDARLGTWPDVTGADDGPFDLVLLAFGITEYVTDDDELTQMLRAARDASGDDAKLVVQPTPDAYLVSADLRGPRYRRMIAVDAAADPALTVHHEVFLDGEPVVREVIAMKRRRPDGLRRLIEASGWAFVRETSDGAYPVWVFGC